MSARHSLSFSKETRFSTPEKRVSFLYEVQGIDLRALQLSFTPGCTHGAR